MRWVEQELINPHQDRFSIRINPNTLTFVPLPSRYLIDDGYWSRFTLLGQSLGSVYLAYQGLCGKEGVWGDVFIGESHAPLVISTLGRRATQRLK